MRRILFVMGLCVTTFNINALASDDVAFQCFFPGAKKGEPSCSAYGRTAGTMPTDTVVHWGGADDKLVIHCEDPSTGQIYELYKGTLGAQLIPDTGDSGNIVDTRFLGKTIDTPRLIEVKDLNWNTLIGIYQAQLSYGTLPLPLKQVSGRCEFRR